MFEEFLGGAHLTPLFCEYLNSLEAKKLPHISLQVAPYGIRWLVVKERGVQYLP